MKKYLCICLTILFIISCATTVPVEKAVEDIAWNTLDMIQENETPVIAVYHLRDLTDRDNVDVSNQVVTRLTIELANAARYGEREITIVSRQTFEEIFAEQNFILSDMSDRTKQIEIGKLLGADLILIGDLTLIGADVFNINTQLIDIESGEILGGDTFDFWIDLPEN